MKKHHNHQLPRIVFFEICGYKSVILLLAFYMTILEEHTGTVVAMVLDTIDNQTNRNMEELPSVTIQTRQGEPR